MMKRFGFTLAEVLITLGIIGVVAAMTIPTLMNNSSTVEFRSGFKKAIAALNQAVTMNIALDGVDFDTLDSAAHSTDVNSLYAMLANRMSTTRFIAATATSGTLGLGSVAAGANNVAMFFSDGSCLIWDTTAATAGDGDGIIAIYDVNGLKKPNRLTNCEGEPAATKTSDAISVDDCSEEDLVVRDQFSVILRGNRAYPQGGGAHRTIYGGK